MVARAGLEFSTTKTMIVNPNRSDFGAEPSRPPMRGKGRAFWWALGGASVLVIVAVVALLVAGDGDVEPEIGEKQTEKVQPAVPVVAKSSETEEETVEPQPAAAKPSPAETNKASSSTLPWANKPPRVIKMRESDIKPRRFVYDSEEDIAALLEIEPGTSMFGDLPYTRFERDFKQAILKNVEIKDDDDEYTKELKRQVQAVKDDLKEIMLSGGDVGEEMRRARNELKELGRFRDSLVRELHELRRSGEYTSQDMKDFEAAANKMLEEKGLKPMKLPAVLLRNMELKERMNKP